MIADKWGISRDDMEAFALESHRRARVAQKEGRFDREIIETAGLKIDETVRDTSIEQIATLEPLTPGGPITAGVSSHTGYAAPAMLMIGRASCMERVCPYVSITLLAHSIKKKNCLHT